MAPDQPRFIRDRGRGEQGRSHSRQTCYRTPEGKRAKACCRRDAVKASEGWSQAEGESVGRLIGTLAQMHGQGKVGRPFAVFKPFKPERLFK